MENEYLNKLINIQDLGGWLITSATIELILLLVLIVLAYIIGSIPFVKRWFINILIPILGISYYAFRCPLDRAPVFIENKREALVIMGFLVSGGAIIIYNNFFRKKPNKSDDSGNTVVLKKKWNRK